MLNVHKIQSLYKKILNTNMIALHWPIMSGQSDCIMWRKYNSQPKFVYLLGPNYHISSYFWKFYLIKTGFVLGEPGFFGENV
jgi:hypothetical protein